MGTPGYYYIRFPELPFGAAKWYYEKERCKFEIIPRICSAFFVFFWFAALFNLRLKQQFHETHNSVVSRFNPIIVRILSILVGCSGKSPSNWSVLVT